MRTLEFSLKQRAAVVVTQVEIHGVRRAYLAHKFADSVSISLANNQVEVVRHECVCKNIYPLTRGYLPLK